MHTALVFLMKVAGNELLRAGFVATCQNERPFLSAVGMPWDGKSGLCPQQVKSFATPVAAEPRPLNTKAGAAPFETAA